MRRLAGGVELGVDLVAGLEALRAARVEAAAGREAAGSGTGAVSVYATGFTNIMDLDFGRDGTLYVLEIDADSLIPPIGPSSDGALFTVPWHRGAPVAGTPVALPAGTLTEPGGLAVGKRGELYVSNHGRQAKVGEVLRISLG
jgi:hypothetical protein